MQREDEIKQAELKRVEAEVRAWRQTEEVKRAARRIASNTLMVRILSLFLSFLF